MIKIQEFEACFLRLIKIGATAQAVPYPINNYNVLTSRQAEVHCLIKFQQILELQFPLLFVLMEYKNTVVQHHAVVS